MQAFNLVHNLRKQGLKVGVKHYRYVMKGNRNIVELLESPDEITLQHVSKDNKDSFSYIQTRGGKTEVWLTFDDGTHYHEVAKCNDKDAFCKRLGILIAVGRIMKKRKEEGKSYLT